MEKFDPQRPAFLQFVKCESLNVKGFRGKILDNPAFHVSLFTSNRSRFLSDLELGVVQPCIHPFVPDQHLMRPVFDNTSVVHDNDSIDAMDGGETMRQ